MIETDWVDEELQTLVLKDKRLVKRAQQIVRNFSQKPIASIAEQSGDWATTKATYNFFQNEKSDEEAIVKAQQEATMRRMEGHKLVLCLQDTTDVDLSEYASIEGRGRLPRGKGKRLGFLAHNTMAVSEEGVPLGILAQQNWIRPVASESKEPNRKRAIAEKESYKWLEAVTRVTQASQFEGELLFVSDRESDVIEYFLQKRPEKVQLLVRATQNRRLEDSPKLLRPTLTDCSLAGTLSVEIRKQDKRPARTALCEVRFRQVTLSPPNSNRQGAAKKVAPVTLFAILVTEINALGVTDPISWLLLTTSPILSFAEACRFIRFYALRWLIERFHFVLKSGCSLEKRRLETVSAMRRLLAIANIVAWRLLWLTYLARIDPLSPCTVALSDSQWRVLHLLSHPTLPLPDQPPSLQEAVLAIAKLGGFLARTHDGAPGIKVLWRGWQRLADQVHFFHILQSHPFPLMGNS